MSESFFQLPALTSHYADPGQHWELHEGCHVVAVDMSASEK